MQSMWTIYDSLATNSKMAKFLVVSQLCVAVICSILFVGVTSQGTVSANQTIMLPGPVFIKFFICSKHKCSVTRWTEQMSGKVGGLCVWTNILENCMRWKVWWRGSSSCLQTAGLSSKRGYAKTCLGVSDISFCFVFLIWSQYNYM